MKTVIISDVHGSWSELDILLEKTGVKQNGAKNPDIRVIFIGDIVDLGRMADFHQDLRTIRIAKEFGDTFLVGNHEFPWLSPSWETMMGFGGLRNWRMETELFRELNKIVWEFATDSHGFLISHAGLHNQFIDRSVVEESDLTPEKLADWLGDEASKVVIDNKNSVVITHIDWVRGGNGSIGGILWCDESLLKPIPEVPQIVGHSFIGKEHIQRDNIWFIDTGKGHPSALIINDDGSIEHVYTED